MSDISPSRLRRVSSMASADLGTVDPCSIFGFDPWAQAEMRMSLASPTTEKRSAGSDFSFGRKRLSNAGVEPGTPVRKARGQSISQSGLVTPQSANRSFSTPSVSMLYTPGHALPSPLDTPLATPSGVLDNPFDGYYDSNLSGWQFSSGLPSGSLIGQSAAGPALHHVGPTRSPSVTSLCSRSDEEFLSTPLSSVSSMTSMAKPGVNPFYCPPACLRRQPSDRAPSYGTFAEVGPTGSYSEGDDAGVSPLDQARPAPNEANIASFEAAHGASTKADTFSFPQMGGEAASLGVSAASASAAAAAAAAAGAAGARGCDHHDHDHDHHHDHAEHHYHHSAQLVDHGDSHFQLPGDFGLALPHGRSRSSSAVSANSLDAADKPFKCTACSKGFRRMEHLRRHQKTHTLERPFACTVPNCGRRFSRTDNLKAHILTHTKKSGRNVYVEGLAEREDIKPIKRRKPRKEEGREAQLAA